MPERLLDVSAVARRLAVSDETVRVWIRADKIAAERTLGGHYRIPQSELTRLLALRIIQKSQDKSAHTD